MALKRIFGSKPKTQPETKPKPTIYQALDATKDMVDEKAIFEELKKAEFCDPDSANDNQSSFARFCQKHKDNHNPLVYAAMIKHVQGVEFILKHCKGDVANSFDLKANKTALVVMAEVKDQGLPDDKDPNIIKSRKIVDLLLENGANPWRDFIATKQNRSCFVDIWITPIINRYLTAKIFSNYDEYYNKIYNAQNRDYRYVAPLTFYFASAIRNSDDDLLSFVEHEQFAGLLSVYRLFLVWDEFRYSSAAEIRNLENVESLVIKDVFFDALHVRISSGEYIHVNKSFPLYAHRATKHYGSEYYSVLSKIALNQGNLRTITLLARFHVKDKFDPYEYIFDILWNNKPNWLQNIYAVYKENLLPILKILVNYIPISAKHFKTILKIRDLDSSAKIEIFEILLQSKILNGENGYEILKLCFERLNLHPDFLERATKQVTKIKIENLSLLIRDLFAAKLDLKVKIEIFDLLLQCENLTAADARVFLSGLFKISVLSTDTFTRMMKRVIKYKFENIHELLPDLFALKNLTHGVKLTFMDQINGSWIGDRVITSILQSGLSNTRQLLLSFERRFSGLESNYHIKHFDLLLEHGNVEYIFDFVLSLHAKLDFRPVARQSKHTPSKEALNYIDAIYFMVEHVATVGYFSEGVLAQAKELFKENLE